MKVEKLMRRLKIEFIKVNILQSSLDSLIAFLISNLFIFILDINISSSYPNIQILAVLSTLVFFVDLLYRSRKYNVELYEEKYPELNEMLRTARDNIDRKNIASQALFDEIVDKAGKINSDSIIPAQAIIQKVLVIGFLSFITIFSGLSGIQLDGNDAAIFENLGPDLEETEKEEVEIKNGSSILGEPSDIEVEERSLEFEIEGRSKAADQEFSFSSEDEEFTSESLREGINEDRWLAKRYSDSLPKLEASK